MRIYGDDKEDENFHKDKRNPMEENTKEEENTKNRKQLQEQSKEGFPLIHQLWDNLEVANNGGGAAKQWGSANGSHGFFETPDKQLCVKTSYSKRTIKETQLQKNYFG